MCKLSATFFILFIGIQLCAAIILTACHLLSINILVSQALLGGVFMSVLIYFVCKWVYKWVFIL